MSDNDNAESLAASAASAAIVGVMETGPNSVMEVTRPAQGGWLKRGNNPGPGRPRNVGRSIIERMNDMQAWSETELSKVAKDRSAPVKDRTAARRLLAGLLDDEQLARPAAALVLDYTDGKPTQRAELTTQSTNVTLNLDTSRLSPGAKDELANLLIDMDE